MRLMSVFHFIKGKYLLLLLAAVALHVLLAIFAPDPNGYVWDFYSQAIVYTYQHGELPAADFCWVCYHPPLLPILGSIVFHVADVFHGTQETRLFAVASLLNAISLLFSIYTFAIYKKYRFNSQLDLIIWAFILFLPLSFISSFSIEADLLVATFIVMSLYYFTVFLESNETLSLCLTAVFVALAALTKYTGLVLVLFYGFILGIRLIRDLDLTKLKQLVVYSMIVFTIGGYPYMNNITEFGRPIIGNKAWNNNTDYYTYNFHDFSIPRIVEVFTDSRPIKLKHYYQYNSEVLNSLYGQLWTDFSFFTIPYRHGQHEVKFIYKGKYMPEALLWAILISGLFPVIFGIAGFILMLFQTDKYLLNCILIVSLGLYIHWFMGHNYWMLKSKYLLYLLPIWAISISQCASIINPVIMRGLLLPCVVFSSIYSFFFAVF